MWLCRTRENDLPDITLLKDDGKTLRSLPGQIRRPDRAQAIPLMDYIKSPLRLGERPERERPDRVGPARLETERPSVERGPRQPEELELVGKSQEVPFRSIGQVQRPLREVLDLDLDAQGAPGASDRFTDGDRNLFRAGPHAAPAFHFQGPSRCLVSEPAVDEVPLLAVIEPPEVL